MGPDLSDHSSDKKRLIEKAIEAYGLERSECIMIGDTLKAAGATILADSVKDIAEISGVSCTIEKTRRL